MRSLKGLGFGSIVNIKNPFDTTKIQSIMQHEQENIRPVNILGDTNDGK